MALPTLMYNCENCTVNKSYRWKTEAVKMKFLRSLPGHKLATNVE
jgi:hypothetical protein